MSVKPGLVRADQPDGQSDIVVTTSTGSVAPQSGGTMVSNASRRSASDISLRKSVDVIA
jgi:hypothetical protein